jgi:hypothetical protein
MTNIYDSMTLNELKEQEAAALWMLKNATSSEALTADTKKDLWAIRKAMSKNYDFNWITQGFKIKKGL